jgi:hypothetical protein
VRLPVDVARLATLPFDVLLLGSLYVLGARIAGRWGGMAAMFAVLSIDLRADAPLSVVYGPSVATGGWLAAALLAAALAALPRHRIAAAALLGTAAVASAPVALAPTATAGVVAATAVMPEGTFIRVKIAVNPADAKILVDGAALPANPFEGKFLKDGAVHRIQVEAAGFLPQSRLSIFDKDLEYQIALQPKPKTTGGDGPALPAKPNPYGGVDGK